MIDVRRTKIYRGPSVWSRLPVVHLTVHTGENDEWTAETRAAFSDQLAGRIPSLEEHRCSIGKPGGFLRRLREGTSLAHALEHIALELQCLTGAEVSRGKTRERAERGLHDVVFEYRHEEVGVAAGELALRLLNHLVAGTEPEFDLVREMEERFIPLAERHAYGPSTGAIVAEAERRGIPVLRLEPDTSLVQLGHGCYQQRILATTTSATSDIADTIARNKATTNRLLKTVGIPVPEGDLAHDLDHAVAVAERIGYPVVVKPHDGNHGRGVCIGLKSEAELRACFPDSAQASRDGTVIVERYVAGKDYRILVIAKRVVAVAERVPAHVVGDGASSVRELIEAANRDPRRGIGHEKILTRIPVNAQTRRILAEQGLDLDDVPEADGWVALQQTGNMSTGGTSIDRTDEIHPDNAEIARQAAMVIGLDVAGIDFLCPDIAQSVRATGGAVVEVNAGPGFRMHTHPTEGQPRRVGRAVVDMLFPPCSPFRVPIVAVTGTNGKTTSTRMIDQIMRAAGYHVGMTTTDGVYIDGAQIAAGDMAGPGSARMVLQNPAIDCAVLETARGGIVRSGLGFDQCDVAVVTNVGSDHLGLGGIETLEELARVKAVVPEAVFRDGASVLNAENEWTARMAQHARGEIIFFAMDEDNRVIRNHRRERGRAVVLRQTADGEMLTLLDNDEETPLMPAGDIPATFDGRLRVNIANALAAAAAAIARGVPLDTIRDALRTFTSDFARTPGRFNFFQIDGRQVLMDYGHNVGAMEAIGDFVARTAASRAIGVIAAPGDRRDEDAYAFGELAGRVFDELIVREDQDRRGRPVGEMAAILRQAACDAGLAPERVSVVLDEVESALVAVERASPGDLVVVLVDRVTLVGQALAERAAASPERGEPVFAANGARPDLALASSAL